MYRYIQIDANGFPVSDSRLSREIYRENMVNVGEDFDVTNKQYVNDTWIEYTPEPITELEPEATQLDIIEANTSYLVMMMEG